MPPHVTIYTDGSALGNPGPGGYGVVLLAPPNHRKEISRGFTHTTNNRMELMAVCAGLEALKVRCNVTLYSDSRYVTDAINKGWIRGWERKRFHKVKNPDLWIRLLKVLPLHNVTFVWVRGHAGNTENERCDHLAVTAATAKNLYEDTGYDPADADEAIL